MFRFICLALVFGIAVASDVIELGDDTFKAGVADQEIALVEFFAPW